VFRLLLTANVVPSWSIPVTVMMVEIRFPKTSVLTKVIRRHIPEDGILHSHRRENLRSYSAIQEFLAQISCSVEWCLLGCYAVWLL
jgi:hypothetical protein